MSWEEMNESTKIHPFCEYTNEKIFNEWVADKNITRCCHNRGEDVPKFLRTGRTTTGWPNSKKMSRHLWIMSHSIKTQKQSRCG